MKNKKGFTLIEVLVVVVLIAIVSLIAYPSYKKGRETSKNELAKATLLEVANAAVLYNEDSPGKPVAGSFCEPVADKTSPCVLFNRTANDDDVRYAYLKNKEAWNADNTFKGYKYYICNPVGSDPNAVCTGSTIAIMEAGPSITDERFIGRHWWVSYENPARVYASAMKDKKGT